MSSQKIKEVDKKTFYSSKEAILLDPVGLSKIVVSIRLKLNDATYKYFCGYLNNDVIKPLCVILPQMSGYIKYFENDGKNMSFVTDDKEVYEKYNEIWNVVKSLLKLKFDLKPMAFFVVHKVTGFLLNRNSNVKGIFAFAHKSIKT